MNAKRIHFLFLLSIIFCFESTAQDTLEVQTFTYEDISKRRGWFEFPTAGESYRKIMMNYKLKCDPQTQQDNFQCGEWDYTTYTDLYTYENVGTPYFILANQTLDSIPYLLSPVFDSYQYAQSYSVYTEVLNETSHALGDGSSQSMDAIRGDRVNHRAQYIVRANELAAAGLGAGSIDKLGVDIQTPGDMTEWLRIRMAHVDEDDLLSSGLIEEGLQTVYELHTDLSSPGGQDLDFTTAFEWDGTSNVLVEFTTHSTQLESAPVTLLATEIADGIGLSSDAEDRHIDLNSGDYVELPASMFDAVDQEVTLSFWTYGDPESMPFNTYFLEGVDAENRRVINVHLPWGNGRVYWDAGNEQSNSYDRIDVEVSPQDFAGKWTHWAFVKDAAAGDMAIYMDGQVIQTGTGKTRSMAGVSRFKLGGRGTDLSGLYDGYVDEFRVWNKALSMEEITDYMNQRVDDQHPSYANLLGAYDFDELVGSAAVDYSPNNADGQLMGSPLRMSREVDDMHKDMSFTSIRPDMTFYSGDYIMDLEENIVTEQVEHPMYSIQETLPFIDQAVSGISYEYIDTSYVYLPAMTYTYAPDGTAIDSSFAGADAVHYNAFKANRHQLQNYVTPYGIGLDLGPDGFRWQYEVTDYRPLFEGLVEIAAGNQQELIDLEFEFIEGTPAREVLDFETIWLGDYQHTAIADDLVMPAVDVTMNEDAAEFALRSRTTGHWFGGFNNCAEFCPKYFNIEVDGVQQFEWLNWKECADNPVIDQGGTWIYDRAGWCPGTFADTYVHELTPLVVPGQTHSINFGMEPYPNGGGEGNYRTTLQLFQYGPKAFAHDLEVIDIISPNIWEYHNRYNPICAEPEIEIRNSGSEQIDSATITYWVEGGEPLTHEWEGSLGFNESAKVSLPMPSQSFWNGEGDLIFYASVTSPNGMPDDNPDNDMMAAEYEMPELITGPFYIRLFTNQAPNENSYTIHDDQGNLVHSNSGFESSTLYRDTMELSDGCYVFRFEDTGHDGLSFFANNDGNGSVRFRYVDGGNIEIFNNNFGSFIEFHFLVDNAVGLDDNVDEDFISISPNPSSGLFYLDIEGYEGSELYYEVYDTKGSQVLVNESKPQQYISRYNLDIREYPEGIYFVRILIDGRQTMLKLIKE